MNCSAIRVRLEHIRLQSIDARTCGMWANYIDKGISELLISDLKIFSKMRQFF